MATGPMDRQPAAWSLLPLRPVPKELESLTSYLTRLAGANGLQSLNELGALAGGIEFSRLKKRLDYLATACPGLARLTGSSPEQWLDLTFFHLIEHFGCASNPHALHNFLLGSLAASLRYCPLCLAEQTPASYSLLWRFLVLSGCAAHGVRLLDHCGHCGSPLPLLPHLPQLTLCPLCQGDLRTCKSALLGEQDRELTDRRTNDLKMLLANRPRPLVPEQAKLIGRRFQELRQQRDLWISEAAHLLGRAPSVIRAIDFGSRQAKLSDYLQYADVLGYELGEIFEEQSLLDLLAPCSEEQLLDQVLLTIHQLQARGQSLRPGSIANLLGTTVLSLKQYPRINRLLSRCETNPKRLLFLPDPKLEEELVKQVEQTLQQFEQSGQPLILQHVCDQVGLTYAFMIRKYPAVRMLFQKYQKNRSERYHSPPVAEETKVLQVQTAINLLVSQGEAVTCKRIRQMVRLTQKQLRRSPRVKALLAPYVKRWQRQAP